MEFGGRGETVADGGGGRSRQRDRRSQGRGGGGVGRRQRAEEREVVVRCVRGERLGENIRGERYGDVGCRGLNEL